MIARHVTLCLKKMIDCLGCGAVHARRLLQFLNARLADARNRAEVAAQRLAPFWADADDVSRTETRLRLPRSLR